MKVCGDEGSCYLPKVYRDKLDVRMPGQEIERTARRTARSQRVDYASPVVVSENSKTKIEALAFIFERGGQEHLSLKINFYKKQKATGAWQADETRSFSLKEESMGRLKVAISHFECLLGKTTNSEYLLVPLGEGALDIGSTEKQTAVRALLSALADPQISCSLTTSTFDIEILKALRGRIRIAELEKATSELTLMLEADEQSEAMYQTWFEDHYWVMGNAYVARDEVRSICKSDKVDMLLKCTSSGKRDILELKKPDVSVLNYDASYGNYHFSAHTSAAIGQCQRYLEVFDEEAKSGLRDARHVLAHYPDAIIVIGRSIDWDDNKQRALRGLNNRLHGIKVMTYDHVLEQAYALLDIIRPIETASSNRENIPL